MNDPVVWDELERVAPGATHEPDWEDVVRRARRRRTHRLALAIVPALLLLVGGAALAQTVGGGFTSWLAGAPGEPAPREEQERFERVGGRSWAAWPERPELRELIRVQEGEATYALYGFRTGNQACLRLRVDGIPRTGPATACLPLHELERSRDLAIPLKANVSLGHVGELPREAGDPPTVPRALAAFGFAAAEAARVELVTDEGRGAARLAHGAFLYVLDRPRRGTWIRDGRAVGADGREQRVPIAVYVSGEPELATNLRPTGPAEVERVVTGGRIGWLDRREPRGERTDLAGAPPGAPTFDRPLTEIEFARVVQPDPRDFLRMAVGAAAPGAYCWTLITRGTRGGSCPYAQPVFRDGPLALSWGFSGVGQQFWIIQGLASDDVARVELFLATGERRPVPLRDNVVIVRAQRAKFPARVVGYDAEGRVIAVTTIRPS